MLCVLENDRLWHVIISFKTIQSLTRELACGKN